MNIIDPSSKKFSLSKFFRHENHYQIYEISRKIIEEQSSVNNPTWQKFAKLLGASLFDEFKITSAHRTTLFRRERNITPIDKFHVYCMAKLVNKKSISYFRDINHLYNSVLENKEQSPTPLKLRTFFLTFFLIEINKKLQILYRTYLRSRFFSHAVSYEQEFGSLKEIEPLCYDILRFVNIPEILEWLVLENSEDSFQSVLMDLSNFMFPIRRLNFRITYNCNVQCRHCYNNSGPESDRFLINRDKAFDAISNMSHVGIKRIGIEGGEPFLYPGFLMDMIQKARRSGIERIGINTNGFWARTPGKTSKVLNNLEKAGFMNGPGNGSDFIKLSSGVYHQEFIDFKVVINLARIYFEKFHRPLIIDYEFPNDSPDIKKFLIGRLKHHNLAENVKIEYRLVEGVGRGKQVCTDEALIKNVEEKPCRNINQISVEPDGTAKPCCGLNAFIKGINIGNINKDSLKTIIKNMQNSPILQFMSKKSFAKISNSCGKTLKPEGYRGICELCEHLLGDIGNNASIIDKLPYRQQYFPFWFLKNKL